MTREQCAHVQTERIGYNVCCDRSFINTIGRGLLHCALEPIDFMINDPLGKKRVDLIKPITLVRLTIC